MVDIENTGKGTFVFQHDSLSTTKLSLSPKAEKNVQKTQVEDVDAAQDAM